MAAALSQNSVKQTDLTLEQHPDANGVHIKSGPHFTLEQMLNPLLQIARLTHVNGNFPSYSAYTAGRAYCLEAS